jgi:fatty-acyl-CoA synthase
MAAIVVNEDLDFTAFYRQLAERLPDYARPLFLRIRRELECTGTFKPKKRELSRESYNPAGTADAVYFYDRRREAFMRLDAESYGRLETGTLTL